jgi:type II secretory pathway pseudopilin PulG
MKQTRKRIRGQAGYILLSVMLLVTIMLIAMTIEAPRIAQQIKREKEEELVHRGKDYAMAIKRFVHKTGRYPTSLEQLEDTNHIRFLRKRYKDPMTIEGEWRLIHQAEAQINFTPAAGVNPGLQGGINGLQGGNNPISPGGTTGLSSGPTSGLSSGASQSGFNQPAANQQGGGQSGNTSQLGSLTVQNIGTGQVGGGPIIGVASMSKATSIKVFNDQTTYDGWLFVYDPRLEQSGGTGIVVAAPRGSAPPAGSDTNGSQGPPGNPPNPPPGPGANPTPPPTMPQ